MAEEPVSLTLQRAFQAPVEAVFAAWTDPQLLRRWIAPGDAVVAEARSEAVVGGEFSITMRGSEGQLYVTRGTYLEVVPNRRLVNTWKWSDSDEETLVTVEFREVEPGCTEVTLTHSRFADADSRDGHGEGWAGCLDKLEALLASLELQRGRNEARSAT